MRNFSTTPALVCPQCGGSLGAISDAFGGPVPATRHGIVCVCTHCSTALHFRDNDSDLVVADLTQMPIELLRQVVIVQHAIRQSRHVRN